MSGAVVTPDMLQRGGGGRKSGKERGDHSHARHHARAIAISSGDHAAVSKHVMRKHLMENRSKTKSRQEESKQNAEDNVMNSILKSSKFKKPLIVDSFENESVLVSTRITEPRGGEERDYENETNDFTVPAKRVSSMKRLSFGDALNAASGKKTSRSKTGARSSSSVDSPNSSTKKKADDLSLPSKKLFEFEDPDILLSFDNSSEGMNKDDDDTLVLTDGPRRSSRRRDKKNLEPVASIEVKRSMSSSSKLRALTNKEKNHKSHDDVGSVVSLKSNESMGSLKEGMRRLTKSAAKTKHASEKSNQMTLQLSQEDEEVLARIAQEPIPSSTYSFAKQLSFASSAVVGSGNKSVGTKSSRSTTSKTATTTTTATSSKQSLMFGREDPIVLIASQDDDSNVDDDESKINRVLSIEMTLEEAEGFRKNPQNDSMVYRNLQDRRKGMGDLDNEGIKEGTKGQSEMHRRGMDNAAIIGTSAAVAGTAAAVAVAHKTKSRKERSHRGRTKQEKNLASTEKPREKSGPTNSGKTETPLTERKKESRKEENNEEAQHDATGQKNRKNPKKQHHTNEREDNEVVSEHKSERTKKSSRESNDPKKKTKLPIERTTGLSSPNKVIIKQENARHEGRKEKRTGSKSGSHEKSNRSTRSAHRNNSSTTESSSDGAEGQSAASTDKTTVEKGKTDEKSDTSKEEKDSAEKEENNVVKDGVKDEIKEIATKQTSESRAANMNGESDFKTTLFGSSMFASLSLTGSTIGQWLSGSSTSEGALTSTSSPLSLFSKKSEVGVSSVLTEVMNEEDADKDDDDAKSVKTSVTAATEATSSTAGSSSTQGMTETIMKAMDHEMKYHQERLLKLESERKKMEKDNEKRRKRRKASKKSEEIAEAAKSDSAPSKNPSLSSC